MAKITLEFWSFWDGILNQKETFDEEELKEMSKRICKPCRELHYCPYWPLVENFPLPKQLRKEAIEHNEYLKWVLKNNEFSNWEKLDKERRRRFEESVNSFDPNSYPEKENKTIKCMSCTEFGHLCPVFFYEWRFYWNEIRTFTK